MRGSLRKLFASPHARDLEQKFSAVTDEHQTLQLEFQGVQNELKQIKLREEEQLADLQTRIIDIEAARDAAFHQVETLKLNLAEASTRLDGAENRVDLLDTQLEEKSRKHQLEMQGVLDRANQQERRLKWVIMLAGFAFLLAGLAGVTEIRGVRKNAELLADVGRDIKDIKISMAQQIASMAPPPENHQPEPASVPPKRVPIREQTETIASNEQEPSEKQAPQEEVEPEIPASVSDISGVRPVNISARPSKQEMQTFFDDNALQPHVISTPSGLQYKVLRRGYGRAPAAADKVVIDYRGFLPDGTEFDNSYREIEPSTFAVNELTPGLKEALLQMEEGAQWELYIPPSLTHKGGARKRGITGYEPHFYVVELISVIPEGEDGNP